MSKERKMSLFVSTVRAAETRSTVWLAALQRHNGNITRASAEFGFTKQRGFSLTKRHGLVDEATSLRLAAGQNATGRPKK